MIKIFKVFFCKISSTFPKKPQFERFQKSQAIKSFVTDSTKHLPQSAILKTSKGFVGKTHRFVLLSKNKTIF